MYMLLKRINVDGSVTGYNKLLFYIILTVDGEPGLCRGLCLPLLQSVHLPLQT